LVEKFPDIWGTTFSKKRKMEKRGPERGNLTDKKKHEIPKRGRLRKKTRSGSERTKRGGGMRERSLSRSVLISGVNDRGRGEMTSTIIKTLKRGNRNAV